jgi:hypothetical protein
MKKWNFQIKSSPKEVSKRLESSLGGAKRFVFHMIYDEEKSVKFKIRKRMLLAFEINAQNNIIVNGKILKTAARNGSDVEVSFTHHTFSKLLIFIHVILGVAVLAALVLEASRESYMYIVGGILLITGFLLWVQLQKNFEKNVQEYKKLISEVLES